MQGPTSAVAVFSLGGRLVVVDGRGRPWGWVGDENNAGPPAADQAFVLHDRWIIVISAGVAWQYDMSVGGPWTEGVAVNEPVPDQEEGPWQYGANVEDKKAAEEEPSPAPAKRKKAHEPA